jgi:long-chain acyl-CoA synthetase
MIRLSDSARMRVIKALLAEELSSARAKTVTVSEQLSWTPELSMQEHIGLDSLGRLDFAARLNQFFHMHHVGIEDYLLIQRSLGEWDGIVAKSLDKFFGAITFQSSGSTGDPKRHVHDVANLHLEVRELAAAIGPAKRVIAMVPPHHIFGFLFTVMLPDALGIDVVDARGFGPSWLAREGRAGDLVVATPHQWRAIATAMPAFVQGITGVVSTAPMPDALSDQLATMGLTRLTQIYGSSETAGIGSRHSHLQPFALFPHWMRTADGSGIMRHGLPAQTLALPDHVDWRDDRHLLPAGRLDGAIQIGGKNVSPEDVRQTILRHPDVADCAVRGFALDGDNARTRLKAFIVPRADCALDCVLPSWATSNVPELLRPSAWSFGPTLPRNDMGKLTDW